MASDHALGRAGRAAGEHQICGIDVEHRFLRAPERRLVRRFARQRVGVKRFARKAETFEHRRSGFVRDRKPRFHA